VRRAENGRPQLELRGNALAMAQRFGADKWHVTISHDAGIAAAFVVLERSAP